jgi:hypothetical protein
VRREQVRELHLAAGERVDDEGGGVGRVDVHRDALRVALDLLECSGQRLGIAEEIGAPTVGLELPRPGERHLDQPGRDGGEDGHGQRADEVPVVVVAAAAPEDGAEHRDAGDERDRHRDGGGHRRDEDVAVLHVCHLVREDAAYFVLVEHLHQPLGHGDDRVVRVATGGERVGLRGRAHVEPGHRHVGALREVVHDGVEPRRFLLSDRDGAGRHHRELVAEPVGAADEDEPEHEPDDEAALPEEGADAHEEGTEQCKQRGGLGRVLDHVHITLPGNVARSQNVPATSLSRTRPCPRRRRPGSELVPRPPSCR